MSKMRDSAQGFESSAPSRRIQVLIVVIALHVLVGYALLSGMVRKDVAAVNKPLQAVVIQEVMIPPAPVAAPAQPPPQKPDAPKQKPAVMATPLPTPPEAKTPAPITPALAMPATTQAPAPVPAPPPAANTGIPIAPPKPMTPLTPATPSAPLVPPSPATPRPVAASKPDIHIACPKQVAPQMPRQALRDGTQGVVRAQAVIRDGAVREVKILSGPSVFHSAVRRAMLQYECTPAPIEIVVAQDFNFKFE